MLSLLLAVSVGVAVLVCTSAARQFRIAPPALLLLAGVLLGFIPALRAAHLPPEAVLLVFLPVLLYWESFGTSLREIRTNLRAILLLSTVLVAATAAVVATAAHLLGMPWGPAWVLGAAVAPTDATAVGVLGRALPRRLATTLRAESLVNDGTALVIYALAVGVTMGEEHVEFAGVSSRFALAYLGGVAIGLATAWLSVLVRRRLGDPFQHNILALATPLAAYLIAEEVEASGVLAVVVSGLWVSRAAPRLFSADVRHSVQTVMGFLTALANAALFVLVGLEVQAAVRGLTTVGLTQGLVGVAVASAAVIGVRFAWLFTSPYVIRLVDRRPRQRELRVGARPRTVMASAGFRGAVSLAAALAVPDSMPDRDLIVFVTAGVIAVTLVVQAPLLPRIVRWARVSDDGEADRERRHAEITAGEEARNALPALADQVGADREIADELGQEFDRRLGILREDGPDNGNGARRREAQDRRLRLAAIAHKHATVVRLRDEGVIDDEVLQRIQTTLDVEEVQIRHHNFGDHTGS
ncbi:Na+/H+ antiporter [Actinoplanes sp. LDG1-06]|uniref:Na+/H+ antiporter n=1 Tax=Paractinoplanes ovalisporus TaxID=2810368 RepID=A0ABS2A7R0_9ACTN|nr:Na+/H+ antiporter [Actinoplanes ovalisporus]MBM2615770.1 Na+/H+ antiporter [Actinoplanes ovalisporus]